MKNILRSIVMAFLVIAASITYSAVPPISVTVSDATGKAAFKGATNSTGAFATTKLQPGNYVVQFRSASPAVKGNYYAVVVSAGKKKVSASAVAGEKLGGGGVALKVDVGAGLNITGQVAAEEKSAVNKNGKKMIWIPPTLGSNMPGHWAEEGSAEEISSRTRGNVRKEKVQEMQSKGVGMGPG
jgi:hypothetical protein